MPKIRTMIIDDEPLAREGVRLLIADDPEIELIGECDNGRDAVPMIQSLKPDLLFLDIQMPEQNGFELLAALELERFPMVVFVTAFDSYAIKAFETRALDYLVKPIESGRFRATLEHVKARFREQQADERSHRLLALIEQTDSSRERLTTTQYLTRIAVRTGDRTLFVPVGQIDWIEAADYCAQLHVGTKTYLIRESLTALESRLDPRQFLRVHRSSLVAIDRVRELQQISPGEHTLTLRDGRALKVGKTYRRAVESLIENRR